MDAVNILHKELGIPKNYIKVSNPSRNDRASAIVHREWIVSLLKNDDIPKFIHHESLIGDEIQSLLLHERGILINWQKILVQIVDKLVDFDQVASLPRSRVTHSVNEPGLTYPQLLHYISDTNYKNLWKQFYKKYLGDQIINDSKENCSGNLPNADKSILIEVLKRFYNCKIIHSENLSKSFPGFSRDTELDVHSNILPALCIIEVSNYFLILYLVDNLVTLKDCISFSPTILNSDYTKPLFIIYQLLQVMKDSHDRGLVLGNLHLDDIFVSSSLFIQVIPNFKDNIYGVNNQKCESTETNQNDPVEVQRRVEIASKPTTFSPFSNDFNLQLICNKWICGHISNFEYLMFLNEASGRRFGDPSCHYIMPWVTDFATKSNGNWRDLSKSKFRLNKGDRQLDLTYEGAANSSQTPHHVSDILSEITYYVYLSRRTPRSVLCKYVRSAWVPAEYPSSIQRLQEWTPDECIPEFFCDPSVFKSLHEDLPDLELPSWALTPEEFIEVHRATLESKHVSDRLHHWIDLTFGYKLSGPAAVKSKNVCLQLVDSHTTLTTSGIIQLFSYPHPQKKTQVPFFEKVPPKLLLGKHLRKTRLTPAHAEKGGGASEDEGQSSGNGEDDSFGTKNSPLVLSKLIGRSKGSLSAPFQSSDENVRNEYPKASASNLQPTNAGNIIVLPKEYNPTALLASVENVQNFFRKTFLYQKNSLPLTHKTLKSSAKQVLANKRIQEMQILGCLIVEIFLQPKLRVIDTSDLDKRIKACYSLLASDCLPRCVRPGLLLLLQNSKNPQTYPPVTHTGLPPPSAHQLLQPLLSSFLFPFPSLFPILYSAICNLYVCNKVLNKFQLMSGYQSDLCDNLNYLKVKRFSVQCNKIWCEILSTKNDQIVELILPYVKDLFTDPLTSKLSVMLLLNKVSQCLGRARTVELLLETLINLYNSKSYNICDNIYLYHKHFLLILIVRCGLKVFLENFIGPLIEATGRYKDSSNEMWSVKTSGDLNYSENDLDIALSPLEEDSSPDVDNTIDRGVRNRERDVEIFFFDKENTPPPSEEATRHIVENLDLKQDLDQSSVDEAEPSSSKIHRETCPSELISIQTNLVMEMECEVGSKDSDSSVNNGQQTSGKHSAESEIKSEFEKAEEQEGMELQICEVAKNSIVWLSHRLGPVLTSRYIVRNLLRMLSLSYTGKDNLEQIAFLEGKEENLWKLSIIKWKVLGDKNAEMILQALGDIAALYGEQIILVQYLPFMADLICLSKRKFTLSLEGGVIGCLSLLSYIIPYLNDNTLMDQLQDIILKTIIHPTVRLVSSTRFCFPSGHLGRYTLVSKLIDTMYLISLRIGAEMTRVHLAVPSLQRFFLAFDKAHGVSLQADHLQVINYEAPRNANSRETRHLEIQPDRVVSEIHVEDSPGQPISIAHVKSRESLESSSPVDFDKQDHTRSKAVLELKSVFNAQLAHLSYLSFFRSLGEAAMENTVKNQAFIRELCFQYEKVQTVKTRKGWSPNQTYLSDYLKNQDSGLQKGGSGSFGSNVSVVGNKIELQSVDIPAPISGVNGISDSEIVSLVSRKIEDTSRFLRGNWLAYWEHEIGRSEKDNRFNFKQIKLQVYSGHGNGVRTIQSLDNENSFVSGSKDKTVKLWSLRSQGDGNAVSSCQYTYNHHRKPLLSIALVQSIRLIASCDSVIHLWDPFVGKTISVLENTKVAPINVLKALNPPSVNLIAATADAALKIVDTRLSSYVSEYKISLNSVGLVRSICVSPSGNWVATGQATGVLTVLDPRTGMVLTSWKGHESEILQLSAVNDNVLLSSSLDQTVAAWNVSDGKFKFHMKGPAEPVHCLSIYNSELITGTTANRIGVHTSIDSHASFSSTKLRSDAFKGILTSMTVLPLNRLLLLGSDTGSITLLC